MSEITLRINGQDLVEEEGQTVLEVAHKHDIDIPTLCHLEGLTDVGSCRLCVVEVKGSRKLMPACILKIENGMEVQTDSEAVQRVRRVIMELIFAERNHVCAVCVADGHCELQDLATKVGMDHVRFPYRHPNLKMDVSHPKFGIDHNRCVLCSRCLRACHELEGAPTWTLTGRGLDTLVATEVNRPWGDASTCSSCGKCIAACPTAALFHQGMTVSEMATDLDRERVLYHGQEN